MTAMRKIEPELVTGMGYIGDNPGVLYRMGGAGEQTVVTGNPALLEGVKGSRFTSLTLHGKSTQGSTTGAQLCDFRNIKTSGSGDIIITFNKDGIGIVKGTPVNEAYAFTILGKPVDLSLLEIGETYTSNESIRYAKKDNPGKYFYSRSIMFTEDIARIDVYAQRSIQDYKNGEILSPMLNKGNTVLAFEPYTGGKPSPSPEYPQEIESAGQDGEIGVEVYGGNLLLCEEEEAVTLLKEYKFKNPLPVGEYRVSIKSANREPVDDLFLYAMNYADGNSFYGKVSFKTKNTIMRPTNAVVSFAIYSDTNYPESDGKTTIFTGLMLNAGSSVVPYEPYKPAQKLIIPTPGGLPGIPVSSGGNYTDKDGQQWVCDEIDLARGEKVQWVKTVVFDGSEKWEAQSGANYFSCQKQVDAKNDAPLHGLSPNIRVVNHAVIDSPQEQNVIAYIYFWRLRLADIDMQNGATVDDLKAFLSKNPITVYYAASTPIRTPLPPETIAAYKDLHTYSPITTVINDAGAGMSVGYKRK